MKEQLKKMAELLRKVADDIESLAYRCSTMDPQDVEEEVKDILSGIKLD